MKIFHIKEGDLVNFQGRIFSITRLLNMQWVVGQELLTNKVEKLKISEISPENGTTQEAMASPPIDLSTEEDWQVATERFKIIQPILYNKGDGKLVQEICKNTGISRATIYRWVELYHTTGLLSSLMPRENTGGRGKSRLSPEIDEIIKSVIEDCYLKKNRPSVQKVCIEVIRRCKNAKTDPPHANTIRYRINQISEYDRLKFRFGKKMADQEFAPKIGNFPGADFPLSVVQIDHTKLDIIVVDEEFRRPIGRPYITMAIDVYSRMVLGFYISLDSPGAMGTGLCICHAILPKEKWLASLDIDGEWPCWGVMNVIHVDNAKEFKGSMLKRACEEYNIQLEWRPVATPHYGGHIERLLGTMLNQLHSLPGTTFSNIKDRKNYNSEKNASFTLKELEKWLTTYIVNIYHKSIHKSLNTTPFAKFQEGIFGTNEQIGIGIPPRILEERKLRLDFMPFIERTIQDYGVVVDNIHYYHDVMRRWINATVPGSGKNRIKQKFIFKRDPRDISIIYFLDPELNEYFPIPYRNTSRPSMSVWEFNEILCQLRDQGKEEYNEDMIFEAYNILRKIEETAIFKTKNNKKMSGKILKRAESRQKREEIHSGFTNIIIPLDEISENIDNKNIEPFDDLDF